jgi:hypothetical protein
MFDDESSSRLSRVKSTRHQALLHFILETVNPLFSGEASMSGRGIEGKMAAHRALGTQGPEGGRLALAARLGARTARMESASRRRIEG